MNKYIIYYEKIGATDGEKMAKVRASSPEKALIEFYKEFDSKIYEVTGYEKILI